jgi:hypothetical protein
MSRILETAVDNFGGHRIAARTPTGLVLRAD